MPDRRTSLLLLAVLLLIQVALVQTAPTLSFPINSQVPPAARIGELLSFSFSSSTFTTSADDSTLIYTLENDPPSWLSVDSNTRRLYGTPQDDDVGPGTVVGVPFTLVATDSTGSTAADNVTLVVSRNAAPTIQIPLTEQIQSFGNYSEPSSILYRPDTNFNFTFAQGTFSSPSVPVLSYYAISSNDDSPLPSWISFDAASLSFTGTTPPSSSLVEPPQTFSLKLIASDIVGFSGVWVKFSIVVGSHTLSANDPNVALNVTAGKSLEYTGLMGDITLDGLPASPSNVNATAVNLPSWLSFDEASWNISGKAPTRSNSTSFCIIFQDDFSDTLNVTFDVQILGNSSLFSSAFPTLTVEPGKHLSFNLDPYLIDSTDVTVKADIAPATPWLSWDAFSLALSGVVPSSATKSVIDVTFTVSTGQNGNGGSEKARKRAGSTQSQKLTIRIESATTTSSQTTTSTSSTIPSTTSSTAGGDLSQDGTGHHTFNWIILVIVICAVVGLALVIGFCVYCCRRRRKRDQSRSSLSDNDGPSTVHREYLSTPGLTIVGGAAAAAHGSPDTEKTAKRYSTATAFKGHNISPNEKERRNKLRKSSVLRSEVSRPESVALPTGPSATIDTEGDHSDTSTPASWLKDWFASIRSFRVVHMRRPNPRFSESNISDDSSHHDLDLDLGPDLTRSGVFGSLRTASRDSLFRSDFEVGVPMFAAANYGDDGRHSRQNTPPEMSPRNNTFSSNEDRKAEKGKKREATPLIPRPLGPTPEGARNRHAQETGMTRNSSGGDPFTDSPVLGLMTPDIILTSPEPDNGAGPSTFGLRQTTSEKAKLQQLLENSHPYSHYSSPPQRRVVSSSFETRGHQRYPSIRPVRSQVSFAARAPAAPSINNSVSSVDSMRSRTRRFARKASSHAKGAVSLASMALGQPKRRTLAALRKNPHLSLRSSKRSIRAIFVNADASGTGGEEGNVGNIYSPTATSHSSRRGRWVKESNSRKGISGFLNPRIWPQPSRTVSAPSGSGSTSPMPWPPTPEIPGSGAGGSGQMRGPRASTSSGQAPASSTYSNPYRWKPVGRTPRASSSRSRLGTPRSNHSSSRGSIWSQHRRRRPRASTSRSKLSSSAGGSGSGRLNGHSFRSFRLQQPQLPIRRRPVGAPERTTPQSTYSAVGGGPASTVSGIGGFPSPLPSLPSPIREHAGSSGGAGLGISTYEDIISSSPFHPSRGDQPSRRSSWTTISGSARGGGRDNSNSNSNNNTPTTNSNNNNSNNTNNASSSSGDALDSSTGTLPNWIVFGRAEDLNLNAYMTRQEDDDDEQEDDNNHDSWFGLDASGNRLPNRESPVIHSPLDWRRFGPPSPTTTTPTFPSSSVERGRGRDAGARGSSTRGNARRSMFLGGGGGGMGLRIVNPGDDDSIHNTNTSASASVGGSVKASTTAQSNKVSEGAASSGRRVFL